ncbi:MAG: fumarylacetoacetate hydrolase family protein [Pseudomonadota bacterium]
MRWVTFERSPAGLSAGSSAGKGGKRLGLLSGDQVAELSASGDPRFESAESMLAAGSEAMTGARRLADAAPVHALAQVRLHAPVTRPRKFLALGLNYRQHALEAEAAGIPIPKHQVWFNKQVTCVNGPNDDIHLPQVSDKLDYEGELALVIGRAARHVRAEDAREVIAGITVANDVSVRNWQMRAPTWTLGKSFDTHGPLGPSLVTLDEVPDLHDLTLSTYVNGERRQHTSTSDMIYRVGEMIEHLSKVFTLEPGDVLLTGTPSGIGSAMNPRRYLVAGDVVRVEIDGIGAIENRVVPEPPAPDWRERTPHCA